VNALPFANKFSNTSQKLWAPLLYFNKWKSLNLLPSSPSLVFTLAIILCRQLMKSVGNSCSHTRSKWEIVITFHIARWKICQTFFFGSSHWCVRNMCFWWFLEEQASKK
jgi:hypothetical protein